MRAKPNHRSQSSESAENHDEKQVPLIFSERPPRFEPTIGANDGRCCMVRQERYVAGRLAAYSCEVVGTKSDCRTA
jgi:hypothetical protein